MADVLPSPHHTQPVTSFPSLLYAEEQSSYLGPTALSTGHGGKLSKEMALAHAQATFSHVVYIRNSVNHFRNFSSVANHIPTCYLSHQEKPQHDSSFKSHPPTALSFPLYNPISHSSQTLNCTWLTQTLHCALWNSLSVISKISCILKVFSMLPPPQIGRAHV